VKSESSNLEGKGRKAGCIIFIDKTPNKYLKFIRRFMLDRALLFILLGVYFCGDEVIFQ
jgi:hypothetical protein